MNTKNTSSVNSGILGAIGNAFSGLANTAKQATGMVRSAVTGNSKTNTLNNKNNISRKNSTVKPVTSNINAPTIVGGAASVNYSVPSGQRQPSEAIMEWATTAGIPTPTGLQMRNVAHGGKRSTNKRRTHRRRVGGKKHSRKHHTIKRKTQRRRHHKKRN